MTIFHKSTIESDHCPLVVEMTHRTYWDTNYSDSRRHGQWIQTVRKWLVGNGRDDMETTNSNFTTSYLDVVRNYGVGARTSSETPSE